MEMRLLDGVPSSAMGGGCFLCSTDLPVNRYVDTGKNMGSYRVSICSTCASQAGMLVGMIDVPAAAALNGRIESQAAELARVERELAQAHTDAEAVAVARRLLAAEAARTSIIMEAVENPLLTELAEEPAQKKTRRASTGESDS